MLRNKGVNFQNRFETTPTVNYWKGAELPTSCLVCIGNLFFIGLQC